MGNHTTAALYDSGPRGIFPNDTVMICNLGASFFFSEYCTANDVKMIADDASLTFKLPREAGVD